ncbi:MAG: PH domain-containing protein [Anaerolineales bacterium]|nr:MAG: PH domain-containing protein [Anaerolineales bacterium]
MFTDPIFGEFHPELIPRRGEFVAWSTAVLVITGWLILRLNNQPVPTAVPILAILLLLAGLSISLGNWMDRRTHLQLDESGIAFQNGFRNVRLTWDDITQVRVFPARWGEKVQVFGENAFFEFRTLGEVKYQGESKALFGFEKGEEIYHQIIISADLQPSEHPNQGYFYVRR